MSCLSSNTIGNWRCILWVLELRVNKHVNKQQQISFSETKDTTTAGETSYIETHEEKPAASEDTPHTQQDETGKNYNICSDMISTIKYPN